MSHGERGKSHSAITKTDCRFAIYSHATMNKFRAIRQTVLITRCPWIMAEQYDPPFLGDICRWASDVTWLPFDPIHAYLINSRARDRTKGGNICYWLEWLIGGWVHLEHTLHVVPGEGWKWIQSTPIKSKFSQPPTTKLHGVSSLSLVNINSKGHTLFTPVPPKGVFRIPLTLLLNLLSFRKQHEWVMSLL